MNNKLTFSSILILVSFCNVLSQPSKSIQRRIHHLEAKGHLVEAAKLHVSLHDEGEQEASINAAMMLYKSGKLKDALFYFQHADSIGSLDNPDEVFAFFQCLKSEKKYKDADELIATHLPKNQNATELAMNSDKSKFYEKLMGYGKTRIKSIPVNTEFSEFGPAVLDGWLYFESSRITRSNDDLHGINNQAYFNLYAHAIGDSTNSVVEPQGSFGKPQVTISSGGKQTLSIPADINKSHHDGPVYLTPDGKHLFYTTNWHHEGKRTFKNTELNLGYSSTALEKADRKDVGKIHLNIYYSTREGNTWSTPVPFPYNSNNYSNQHGYFDEKTGTLYYSSNMPGGVGGFDIWRSVLKGNSWSQPENLGSMVNTVKQEVFPVLSPDGLLIFSSNGWPGLGGLDLFVSENNDEEPINLLAGMNTEKDDFGMLFVKKGVGYFVSNRNESVGDDDIFEFELYIDDVIEYSRNTFELNLINAVTKEKIAGSVVVNQKTRKKTVSIGQNGGAIKIAGKDAELEASSTGFYPAKSSIKNFKGEGPIVIALQPAPPSKPEVAKTEGLNALPAKSDVVKDEAIKSESVVINLIPVYFDYKKYNIRADAARDLDKLVETLNANPKLTIEASSHTDCRGSVEFNNSLSEKRLNSTLDYLRKRIINPERLNGVGMGESKPAADCDCEHGKALKCDEKTHQSNRRTEFKVVKY